MPKNISYFKAKEDENIQKLSELNELKNWFKTIEPTPKGYEYDASGVTSDGRAYNVELKTRDAILTETNTVSGSNFNDDTVIIESEKVGPLLWEYNINEAIPLYINFLTDGTVLIWNLASLKVRPKHECIVINNKGYGKMYKGYRDYLPVGTAIIYPKLLNTNEG